MLPILLLLPGCRDRAPVAPPSPPRVEAVPHTPVAPIPAPTPVRTDWAKAERAEAECGDCHPDDEDAWRASPMGRSFGAATAPQGTPASARHPGSGLRYSVGEGFGVEAPGFSFERAAAFQIGSGAHARTYLWRDGEDLFELPMTWYASRRGWDLSPGFGDGRDPGFRRRVEPGCLACHANAFGPEPHAMGCSRCHGEASVHAAGDAPGPTRLSPERERDVCAFCHLTGAARLLRFERDSADFTPGEPLADVVAVFVRQTATDGFNVSSHGGRLARSACATKSPQLLCTTCHRPHAEARDRSAACRDCHKEATACAGPGGADCASCHMVLGEVHDIPHVSMTDHFIRVRPEPAKAASDNDSPLLWIARPEAEPSDPDHQILLGRAYVEVWRNDGQRKDADRAERFLGAGLERRPKRWDGWLALATLRRLRGQIEPARRAAEAAWRLRPDDPRVALVTGALRLASGEPASAIAAFAQARDDYETNTLRARASLVSGDATAAMRYAERAHALHPTDLEAALAVGAAAHALGDPDRTVAAYDAATKRAPEALRGWLQLGRAHADGRRWKESGRAYAAAEERAKTERAALAIAQAGQATAALYEGQAGRADMLARKAMGHGHRAPGALTVLGRLALAGGDPKAAVRFLEGALEEHPRDADAWLALSRALAKLGQPRGAATAARRAAEAGHPEAK